MGITKLEGFSSEITEMADMLKVLGHPARWSIMQFLAKYGILSQLNIT